MVSTGAGVAVAEKAPGIAHESGERRLLTVANGLSLSRLALVAVFLWLLFAEGDRVAAMVVLAVAGMTDFVDGYVARRFNQVTTVGKVLDPTADRIVLATGVVAIAVYGAVPFWLAGVVLGREALVSIAVLALAAVRAPRIDVLFIGKAGTFGLMAAFPLFLLADTRAGWGHVLADATWVLALPALALSLVAAVSYVPLARRSLARRSSTDPMAAGETGLP